MVNPRLEVWQENENGTFYQWPFFKIGVQMKPAAALPDVCAEFGSILLDKESAGRVLARIIDQGRKAGITVNVHFEEAAAATEGLPQNHRLIPAIAGMNRNNGISTSVTPTQPYSKTALRRLFGLS